MGLRGTLTRDCFGFSMPCDAPLYPAPPYLYEGATMLTFDYVTNPKTAVELLPAVDGLELTDPPRAGVVFAVPEEHPRSVQRVRALSHATFRGKEVQVRRLPLRHDRRRDGRGPGNGRVPQEDRRHQVRQRRCDSYRGTLEPGGPDPGVGHAHPRRAADPRAVSSPSITSRSASSPARYAAPRHRLLDWSTRRG